MEMAEVELLRLHVPTCTPTTEKSTHANVKIMIIQFQTICVIHIHLDSINCELIFDPAWAGFPRSHQHCALSSVNVARICCAVVAIATRHLSLSFFAFVRLMSCREHNLIKHSGESSIKMRTCHRSLWKRWPQFNHTTHRYH